MAAVIFHGAPGSFKSASAVWFEVLPALRKGRLVVTNIEGILPLQDIEFALGEEFPQTAELWRISSQSDAGLNLWRNWYHWMPCGALIVMDEVQDIYPTESSFKAENYDYKHVSFYKDLIPNHYYETYLKVVSEFKAESNSGDIDDLNQEIYNEHGHIIYPRNLKEAYMRHRKYNWDIINATPDISSVHKYIRAVCQYAYKHKYFDGLSSLPYFYRRPRIHEHTPKENGIAPKKGDKTKWKKIPLDVHKCYKSTATGNITNRKGANIFASALVLFPLAAFLICLVYGIILFSSDEKAFNVSEQTASVSQVAGSKVPSANADNVSVQNSHTEQSILDLPYHAKRLWYTGAVATFKNGFVVDRFHTFELELDEGTFTANSDDLKNFGFTVQYINDCLVNIRKHDSIRMISCKPNESKTYIPTSQKDDLFSSGEA